MDGTLQSRRWFKRHGFQNFLSGGVSLLLLLAVCGTAVGQQVEVSGTVTSAAGDSLRGVLVRVQGTDIRTATDETGQYTVSAPSNSVLIFAAIGYRSLGLNVSGRSTVDVIMEESIAVLDEIVVTSGYTEQRRADITGAVSSVDLESVSREMSASVLKRLDGRVPGVTVDASGSPGSRSTVRIRGISSFQNNDPLYVIDGTPVEDSYVNWLNPNNIESIQVLKDASAASIYGSRANNGVVVIETKKGRPGRARVQVDVRTGVATPTRGYNDFLILDSMEYYEIVQRSYENAGLAVPENIYGAPSSPSVPAYTWPNDGVSQTTSGDPDADESLYAFPDYLIMAGSDGTDWWDAVFGPAFVGDYNVSVSGGTEESLYNVSFNYFNQEGTSAFTRFQRGTIRANTEFTLGPLTIGENAAFSIDEGVGGLDDGGLGENNIIGKNMLMQPVVPVYDIGGNFASGKAPSLGNNTNPLKLAWGNKDDKNRNTRFVGSVFAGLEVTDDVTVRTRFGFNLGDGSSRAYNPILPENSEPSLSNSITENFSRFTDWTWSNTLNYQTIFGSDHNLSVLLGHEANETTNRFFAGSIANLITTDINARFIQDAIGDPDTKDVSTIGSEGSLLSFFGRADYNMADRYHLSFTLRRDGSSRLGPSNRWGTFPAVGAGWRVSQESFLAGSTFITNLMLRFGWGLTGNQNIPSGRIVSQFGGGLDDTFYAIGGGNTIDPGFRQTSLGNTDLKWEENESINLGLDVELSGRLSLTLDVYQRETDNLLFDPPTPATAGVASPPIVNIGKMRNRGIEFAIGYQGQLGNDINWNVAFNGSHYKNEIVRIDGVQDFFYGPIATRFGNQVINQIGHPIGSFYGYISDGLFLNQEEVDEHANQEGAAPGRLRFQDVNDDGDITLDDRAIIGSPHPDFTAGLDLGVLWGQFDFSATLYGTFGNEIFDVQKEFYVFRNFSTNVRRDLLTESAIVENGEVTNPDAKYPRLDVNDTFSRDLSSFYIEDGSYVRLRNLQVGYRLPAWLPGTRVFLQGENLFTITGYPGLDPSLPAASVNGPAGDIRDQYRGVDRGVYPSNRTFSLGISASF